MRILGNFNIGKSKSLIAATTGLALFASAPIVNAKPQLRTDSFERTVKDNGQVEIVETKTIIRNPQPEVEAKPVEQPQIKSVEPSLVEEKPVEVTPVKKEVKTDEAVSVKSKKVINPSDVPPAGTTDAAILAQAPSPKTTILGKEKIATIVIDLSTNILYKYDKNGNPEIAYRVASGKKSTPTAEGIRLVTHTETYPYKSAPAVTKRRQNPQDYGPKLIGLTMIDPRTGRKWVNGEFIHGNNNRSSIGKYASKGCVRMDNEVIKVLAKQVKAGDVVIMKRY